MAKRRDYKKECLILRRALDQLVWSVNHLEMCGGCAEENFTACENGCRVVEFRAEAQKLLTQAQALDDMEVR